MKYRLLVVGIILFGIAFSVNSQPATNGDKALPLTRILFVLDGSQSMLTKWESGTKMQVAQRLLHDMVDSLRDVDHVQMALRVYGHQSMVPPQDCGDTKLEVPFGKNNADLIIKKLYAIYPKGTTPIAYSLEMSADDFPVEKNVRNVIILITDGIESCDGDPCAVSLSLQEKGIVLKPFVIGIGLDMEFRTTFECIGRFYNATDEDRFKEVLNVVVSQALNTTSMQVDLLDSYGKPTESNVNMTFYDSYSGAMMYNFMHTLNQFGRPDTLRIDPIPTYRIKVHTIPPVQADQVVINPGEHTTVSINAPQGKILIKTQNSLYHKDLKTIVQQVGDKQILNVQLANVEEKYLIGDYHVEILTTPRTVIDHVQVKQSETFMVQIPNPGLITFTSTAYGYGAIYQEVGNELIWVMNLNSDVRSQTIAIQPGKYRVIARPKNAIESAFTTRIPFEVVSGEANKITLF